MTDYTEFTSFDEFVPYEDAAETVWSLTKGCSTNTPGCQWECVYTQFAIFHWHWQLQSDPAIVCVPPGGSCDCACNPGYFCNGNTEGNIEYTFCCCLIKGTKVTLANGRMKNIEDIKYNDSLRVWNFDDGNFDEAFPLWIKKPEKTNQYILLEFSNGSQLKTVSQHRIFNKQKGMFTYPMTDDTPLGTISFTSYGDEVRLINKQYVDEEVEYFNIITKRHINHFANNILTSCRYNNLYPIKDMKYVKEPRVLRKREEFSVSDEYFYEMRLDEQLFSVAETEKYISNLESLKFRFA